MLDQKTIDKLKTALKKEQETLIGELKTIATPDPHLKNNWDVKHFELDENETSSTEELEAGENAIESDEDAKNKALSDNLELRLKEVNDALSRMGNGTYGICEVCQKEIPVERLKANPAARTDLEHAKKYAG